MPHIEDTAKDRRQLLDRIAPILLQKGLKSTTMDTVAAELGMSKRTLYEIFGSKSEMLKEALDRVAKRNQEFSMKAFEEADNVMEAFVNIFRHNRDLMGNTNVNFYRDMDNLYKERREDYDRSRQEHYKRMEQLFHKGVEQGMFRPDVDYSVQIRVMALQLEALKRIEELFPPDITLIRVYDALIIGFLRSIASPDGMKILDRALGRLSSQEKIESK